MIKRVYKLIAPRNIKEYLVQEEYKENQVVVRPLYLSICAADQRYYQGKRSREILEKKLPMALIHEAVGKVIESKSDKFKKGDFVVLVPNLPLVQSHSNSEIQENYRENSKFMSSGIDGFLQEVIIQDAYNLQKIPREIFGEVFSFIELVSVAFHSIERFEKIAHQKREILAVYGDGNLGFITSLLLKYKYPKSKVIVIGRTEEKLNYFSFTDAKYVMQSDIKYDHAFECVGGIASEDVIENIIRKIRPQGIISLLGVSEQAVEINTRTLLEKGLIIVGSSRSSSEDFNRTIEFINENKEIIKYLKLLINVIKPVENILDLIEIFEQDSIKKWGKTIIEWKI